MMTTSLKTVLIAGKAAAVATLMGGAAFAQVSVDTPAGTNVTVPQAALEGQAPAATVAGTGYDIMAQAANDDAIINSLESQGFTGIEIARDGTVLTVNADRDGTPIELIYSTATGRLISVDGVPVGPEESDFVVVDGLPAEAAPAGTPVEDTTGQGTDLGVTTDAQPGLPGETDGGDPDAGAGDGTDVSDPGADEGEDGTEAEGEPGTDGAN